jgi:hypothetical protein
MEYTMTGPCPKCPFRTDIRPFLRKARAREITSGAPFQCHATVDYTANDDGRTETPNAQHCAGLLILLEHMGRPHQMMRICERLGLYDRRKLSMNTPVFRSSAAFVKAQPQ